MSCQETRERIAAGEPLQPGQVRHLGECHACRELRDDVEHLSRLARSLPRPALRARSPAGSRRWPALALAVGVVLAVTGAGLLLARRSTPTGTPPTPTAVRRVRTERLDLLATLNQAQRVWSEADRSEWSTWCTLDGALRDSDSVTYWNGLQQNRLLEAVLENGAAKRRKRRK